MKLSDPLSTHFRLMDVQKSALTKLGIKTVRDLLYHFPFRYEAAGGEASVSGLVLGQEVSVIGVLEKMETKKAWKSRRPVSEGYLRDTSGRIKMRWFNQPYIAKMYIDGTRVRATGKVSGAPGKLYLANPQLQKVSATELQESQGQTIQLDNELATLKELQEKSSGRETLNQTFPDNSSASPTELFAVYPETKGVTSLWFRHAIKKVLAGGALENLDDPLPPDILKKYHLPALASSIVWMHAPLKLKDAEAARKRFAFEEVFFIQLARGVERALQAKQQSFAVNPPKELIGEFVGEFPFTITPAQEKAIGAILNDMKSGQPMSR